ncbi:MAG: hypothetical protein ACR2JS_06850 [Candidatus Nanopelagicales bacterium]
MAIPSGGFPVAGSGTTPPIYPSGGTGNAFQTNGFIPEIWSGKLVEKFYASTVLSAISNTDYEGEIRNQGDRVKIRTKPTITIRDYRADGTLTLERPEGSNIELYIGNGKYFNTILDDVMDIQSDLNALSIWSDDAAQQLKIQVDTDVLGGIKGGMNSANKGTSAGKITGSINLGATTTPLATVARSPSTGQVEILDVLLRLGQVLDEQNIPEDGRWVVMPVWAVALLKFSDLRQAYLTGDSISPLRNGRIGMIDRFTVYSSNLLPSGTAGGLASGEFVVYAGHAHGLTFAAQISKVETLRSELTFGTILRGLQVYGYQIVDGTALAQAVVTKA